MEALLVHLQANAVGYGVVVVFLAPLLYFGRKYTTPILFYTFEIVLYSALFHAAFGGGVRFLAWFKGASEFQNIDTVGSVAMKDFTTPIVNFWMKDMYIPVGLFYFECLALFVILCIVVYYRPMSHGTNYYKGNDKYRSRKQRPRYAAGNGKRPPGKGASSSMAYRRR